MPMEMIWLYGGLGALSAAVALTLRDGWIRGLADSRAYRLLLVAALAFGAVLTERWLRTGFGPFATLFDILLSNLFSLCLIYGLLARRFRRVRCGSPFALLVLVVMGAWLTVVPHTSSALPTAFDSYWLWAHLVTGKLFLGIALAVASLALVLLLETRRTGAASAGLQEDDLLLWRLFGVAFVLHGLMLIAGAVWAQDAWGRYWGWDPLETWSLLTWLLMGVALHMRVTFRGRPQWGWGMTVAVFLVAFLTLFGVPFLSEAPHRGLI
ncbi:MAG: cytochrome c biogenesis protein CcsA [Gammaproteobacteria bacterium]